MTIAFENDTKGNWKRVTCNDSEEELGRSLRETNPEYADTKAAEHWDALFAVRLDYPDHLPSRDRCSTLAANLGFSHLAPSGHRLRPFFELRLFAIAPPDIRRSFHAVRAWLTANLRGHLDTLFEPVPVESDLDAKLKAFIAQDTPPADLRERRKQGQRLSAAANEWVRRLLEDPKINAHEDAEISAALERHGCRVSRTALKPLRP